MNRIQQQLLELKDNSYKEFHAKLIPTVEKAKIIGVRTPVLRKYAKELLKQAKTDEKVKEEVEQFMEQLPHIYYEENNLHGLLIEGIKEYEECVQKLDSFLPYVDNWATCDLLSMKLFKKYPQPILEKVKQWMASKHTYTVRFGIETLMRYYLEESFNRFLIISLDVLICRYSPLFRAFPALFISEEPHKSFYYPSCFHSQK